MARLLSARSLHLSAASVHRISLTLPPLHPFRDRTVRCILRGISQLSTSVFQGLPANHVEVVVLVTSGRCWPSAADEEWYSLKGLPAQWQSNTAVEAK